MKDYFSNLPQQYSESKKTPTSNEGGQQQPTPVPLTPEAAAIMGVVEITKESIRCFTEYAKCREHEITKRKRITAALKAVEYQIDAQKEVYLKYLDSSAAERNRLYDMLEKTQEKALELGDKEMLQICYNLILEIYHAGNSGLPTFQISSMF